VKLKILWSFIFRNRFDLSVNVLQVLLQTEGTTKHHKLKFLRSDASKQRSA